MTTVEGERKFIFWAMIVPLACIIWFVAAGIALDLLDDGKLTDCSEQKCCKGADSE